MSTQFQAKEIELLASDLDGTLKSFDQEFAEKDIEALYHLRKMGVVRVIATGRSQHFAREVLYDDFPIDYLIFASGAGIVRWRDKKLIFQKNIERQQTSSLMEILRRERLPFMLHKAVPEEHLFYYCNKEENSTQIGKEAEGETNAERDYYCRLHSHHLWGEPLPQRDLRAPLAQGLAFIDNNPQRFAEIAEQLPEFKVVRTSSPIQQESDGGVIWIEIFKKEVSKGAAVKWLCRELGINEKKTAGLGNDYNDLDLLESTAHSWVVAGAPADLRQRFTLCNNLAELVLQ